MGAACSQAAPVVAPDAALPAESNGLKVSIAPTSTNDNSDLSIALHRGDPHLNVVLQNTSDKPIRVYQDWNSWGYSNLTLQVTAIDGKTLDKPLKIERGPGIWFANIASTDVINAGETIVREVRLNLPPEIFDATKPATVDNSVTRLRLYFGFPFPPPDNFRTLTIRALFSNDDAKGDVGKNAKQVWTGQIASPLKDYRVYWDAD